MFMKNYFNEGLIPMEVIEELFERMMLSRRGTILKSFEKNVKKVISKYEQELFSCSYMIEGYINEVAREVEDEEVVNLKPVIQEACKRCLRDCLHDNVYTFVENYIEMLLYDKRVSKEVIASFHMGKVMDFVSEKTTFNEIHKRVKKYVKMSADADKIF